MNLTIEVFQSFTTNDYSDLRNNVMGHDECAAREGLISIVQLGLLCAVTQGHSGQTFSCHGLRGRSLRHWLWRCSANMSHLIILET